MRIHDALFAVLTTVAAMSAPLAATGTITASPNPCTLTASGTCTTTLNWTSSGAVYPSIYVRAGNGPLMLMAGGDSGEVEVPWITAYGNTFELHAGPLVTDAVLDSVVVTGIAGAASGRMSATPNPCTLSVSGTCTTTLTWSSSGAAWPTIYVRAGDGPLVLMAGGASGSLSIPWIMAAGNTFELHAGPLVTDALLAKVVVNATAPLASGMISATPNPCVLSTNGTCTTNLSWTTNRAVLPSIYVRAGNGPLMLMAGGESGSLSIPWITAAGNTFELHAGPSVTDRLLASVQVVGAAPAQWLPPQLAPFSSASFGVYGDGVKGIYLVGNCGGVCVQHFNTDLEWTSPTIEMKYFKSVQVVALEPGVALFGHDDASWYRLDYTAAGRQTQQPIFAVDYPNGSANPANDVRFSRGYDGTIVAASFQAQGLQGFVQTRGFQQGQWSKPELVAVEFPSEPVLQGTASQLGGLSDFVRSQSGDVALLWYSTALGTATFVARRAPGDSTFKPETDACYVSPAPCATLDGGFLYGLRLEPNGSATATLHGWNSTPTDQWLLFDTTPSTVLWSGYDTQLNPLLTRMIRPEGTPLVLSSDGTQLQIAERDVITQINCGTAQAANCAWYRATFDRPSGSHLAALQNGDTPTLYVIDRVALGDWRGRATIDLSPMKFPGNDYFQPSNSMELFGYVAGAEGEFIIGGVVVFPVVSPGITVPKFMPFVVARPAQ